MDNTRLFLRLFGHMEVLAGGQTVGRPKSKKARMLVGFLGARAGTPVPRLQVAEFLWPDSDAWNRSGVLHLSMLLAIPRVTSEPMVATWWRSAEGWRGDA